MTINHLFVMVSKAKMPAMRAFYGKALKPLGYTELVPVNDSYIGFGSDYPYLWLKAISDDKPSVPVHIAVDAPDSKAVDEFHNLGIKAGGTSNGSPGIRPEYGSQPYYAAYIIDPDGNNLEAVSKKI